MDSFQVAFSYVLDSIVNGKLKSLPEAWPFLKPVNKKFVKDYYSIVKKPMDLETVAKKIKNHKYHDRTEFLSDIELILVNSIAYNGQESQFTEKAKALVQICAETLEEVSTPPLHFKIGYLMVFQGSNQKYLMNYLMK